MNEYQQFVNKRYKIIKSNDREAIGLVFTIKAFTSKSFVISVSGSTNQLNNWVRCFKDLTIDYISTFGKDIIEKRNAYIIQLDCIGYDIYDELAKQFGIASN